MPDPNNPLSYIGASNDPTLGDRVKQGQQGTLDLQRGLGQIAAQGQNARRLAGINNESTEYQSGMTLGLNSRGKNNPVAADLSRIGRDISNVRQAGAHKENTAGALNLGHLGIYPTMQPTLGQTALPSNVPRKGIPLGIRESAAAQSEAAEITAKSRLTEGETLKDTGLMINDKLVPFGSVQRERKNETQTTTQAKFDVPIPEATRAIIGRKIEELFPNKPIRELKRTGPGELNIVFEDGTVKGLIF